jgi:hypothetical protein
MQHNTTSEPMEIDQAKQVIVARQKISFIARIIYSQNHANNGHKIS